MELVQTYFENLIKITIITTFIAFFYFFILNISLLDPDPQPCLLD